jgi:cobalt-zinc-cadmium efflux system outer membrane protein
MKMARILITIVCWTSALAAQSPSESAANPPKTVTLEEAIHEALSKNLELAVQRYNISLAEARQIQARLRPNPVLTVSGDHLDLLGTHYDTVNNAGPNEYSVRTDFVLERAGKRDKRMALGAIERSISELGVRDAMRKVIFEVQSAFVEVLLAKEQLALARDNLKSLNGIVQVNTERVRTGDLASVELSRSQVAALQYQTSVRQAEMQFRQVANRLQLLLGRTILADDFDVAGPFRSDAPRMDLDALKERAPLQRPDLLALEQAQVRSQADLRLQIANGKVDYSVGTEYRRQQAPSGTGNSLGFFFSAPLPLFHRNQGEIARAEQELAQARARILALQASVNTEVSNTWVQYLTSKRLFEDISTTMLPKAKEVRETTEYSYRRGEASLVEFLDAQRAFNDAMQSFSEARAAYSRSLYLLDAMTGASVVGTADPTRDTN